jgi:hypothetical protein
VVKKYNDTVIPRPVRIAFGIIVSGFLTSSPNVANREYPVKAKNQILLLRSRDSIVNPSVMGMTKLKFSEETTEKI